MEVGLHRRELLAGAGSLAALSLAPASIHASEHADAPLSRVKSFLSSLLPSQTKEARFEFGGDIHRRWNFMGTSVKPGFPIERMSTPQKEAAYSLLKTALSRSGYDKMRLVMATQDVMREMGRSPASRNSERFSIAVFGEPAANMIWGLRVEGHHLSLNWSFRGNELVAITPNSFSVIPQSIPIGSRKGTLVLEKEEVLARKLIDDLGSSLKAQAIIAEQAPRNVLALAGNEDRFNRKQGVAVSDLGRARQDLLWELIETTAVAPWPSVLADKQRARIREGDREAVHFAWAGSARRGEMFYYRIHGDTFTIELASVFGDPEHLHATFHDPERTFARHLI